ncbi:MAG: hypothetical protein NTV51_11105 [Verrucomicrobia bacterium]|nr:hypothetical protein [Verrucomicrobiota bacterium]
MKGNVLLVCLASGVIYLTASFTTGATQVAVGAIVLSWILIRWGVMSRGRSFVRSLGRQLGVVTLGVVLSFGLSWLLSVFVSLWLGPSFMPPPNYRPTDVEVFFDSCVQPVFWTVGAIGSLAAILLACRSRPMTATTPTPPLQPAPGLAPDRG